MAYCSAMAADFSGVEQRHHRAAYAPEDKLHPKDQADPFVNAPEEQRRQAGETHGLAFARLRPEKLQTRSQAPEMAMAAAVQVATRRSGLFTSARSL